MTPNYRKFLWACFKFSLAVQHVLNDNRPRSRPASVCSLGLWPLKHKATSSWNITSLKASLTR